jgi:histidine triad (HIT) family protein
MNDTDCVFCKIIAGDIPAEFEYESENVVAFKDIAPQAPTHILVTPRQHLADVTDLAAAAPDILVEMIDVAQRIADDECGGQFRLIFNTGPRAGQSVYHVHGHVIGGADLGWSPA